MSDLALVGGKVDVFSGESATKRIKFTVDKDGNVTVAPTLSSPNDGQTINWRLKQDATGSRTMTWPAAFDWPGGTVPALSTAANAVDLLVATYFADTGLWLATLTKDFK